MDVTREFKLRPPVEPLSSLGAMIRDWKRRTAPGGGLDLERDDIVEYCKNAPTLREAVFRACASRRPDGRMHNHQTKVRETSRMELYREIMDYPGDLWHFTDFDKFHDYVDSIKPWGIGPVTVYDVAVRIGAYLGFEPKSLYLHAGVRKGWQALRKAMPRLANGDKVLRLEPVAWPGDFALAGMKADEVEDFLCTYRSLFGGIE